MAIDFDDTSSPQFLSYTGIPFDIATSVYFSAWVKMPAIKAGGGGTILNMYNALQPQTQYVRLITDGTAHIEATVFSGISSSMVTSSGTIAANTWTFIQMEYIASSSLSVRVGNSSFSMTSHSLNPTLTRTYLGATRLNSSDSNGWNGQIAEVDVKYDPNASGLFYDETDSAQFAGWSALNFASWFVENAAPRYWPLTSTSDLTCRYSGNVWTNNSTTSTTDHPNIIRPAHPMLA